jgi:dolichyl-phosphate-mannose-protein mannosyltransferase
MRTNTADRTSKRDHSPASADQKTFSLADSSLRDHNDRVDRVTRSLSVLRAALRQWSSFAGFLERWPMVLLGCVTLVYLFVTVVLAVKKPFWNDELFTFYITRLPAIADVWKFLLSGAEQLPILFFGTTRAFTSITGYSELSFRLPEILGYWVMSLSLFFFVRKRSSAICGAIAMLFPLVTRSYYYAYEARPYGLILGFSGLALLCWQNAAEGRSRAFSIAGLWLSLAAAVSCHYYAILCFIPIGVGEIGRTIVKRRVDGWVWAALVAGLLPLVFFLPLIRAGLASSSQFWARPNWVTPFGFFERLLEPAPLVFFAIPLIMALRSLYAPVNRTDPKPSARRVSSYELTAAATFVLLPFLAVTLAKVGLGTFTDRYAVEAVIGLSILLALSVAKVTGKSSTAALCILFILVASFILSAFKTYGELIGKVQGRSTTYRFLHDENSRALPIVIAGPHLFFELSHIAAQRGDKAKLIYLADPALAASYTHTDDVERGMLVLRRYAPIDVRDLHHFCASHKRFLVYGYSEPFAWLIQELSTEGWSLTVKAENGSGILFLASANEDQ